MSRVIFKLSKFPQFTRAHLHDECDTWRDSLRVAGFLSVEDFDDDYGWFSMSEEEYTWFILRWS